MNMVFGLQFSMARAGSSICLNVMDIFYDYFHQQGFHGHKCLGITYLVASLICSYDLVMAIIMTRLNPTLGKEDKKIEAPSKVHDKKVEEISKDEVNNRDKNNFMTTLKQFNLDYWVVTAIILFYYMSLLPFISFGM